MKSVYRPSRQGKREEMACFLRFYKEKALEAPVKYGSGGLKSDGVNLCLKLK